MKWVVNIIGEEKVWYSEDVVNKILNHFEHFCNTCPYKDSEENVCNTHCLLDEISTPVYDIIVKENKGESK